MMNKFKFLLFIDLLAIFFLSEFQNVNGAVTSKFGYQVGTKNIQDDSVAPSDVEIILLDGKQPCNPVYLTESVESSQQLNGNNLKKRLTRDLPDDNCGFFPGATRPPRVIPPIGPPTCRPEFCVPRARCVVPYPGNERCEMPGYICYMNTISLS